MDLLSHQVQVIADGRSVVAFSMAEGTTANDMSEAVFALLARLGLEDEYDRADA